VISSGRLSNTSLHFRSATMIGKIPRPMGVGTYYW
jgi:hypothetical protein